MEIRLLILQRKGAYEGEYAPEALAVCDYSTLDENPDWWVQEKAKQKTAVGDDAESWAEISVYLSDKDIRKALDAAPPKVRASSIEVVDD